MSKATPSSNACRHGVASERAGALADSFRLTAELTRSIRESVTRVPDAERPAASGLERLASASRSGHVLPESYRGPAGPFG
jgi:hypothetical protein